MAPLLERSENLTDDLSFVSYYPEHIQNIVPDHLQIVFHRNEA